ncbi:CDP-alcohol phosphatidyltransferase [Dictyocaulus viviparus]|uniref:diacylglycerol cholinephosphotransferase n=1 Tax=Dictyocaulus viviparus TaxID=29172 RepID=A0A0D8XK93_DICVI|nr:CDP-alcohol phosphatidyltransferase [Dictyocaulus viviparus]
MNCNPGPFLCSLWWRYIQTDSLTRDEDLKRLGEHKYSAVDNSWLDELCMKKWWDYVVTWCPIWLAPNLITLIGLIINLVTVLILSSFSYSATEPAPSWAYAQAALGLFLYQTLDAIDGKQARRTGTSSPLGELFDHGCDSLAQVFVTLNICYAMSLGHIQNAVVFVSITSVMMFYAAHWSTYCTGQLRFSKFDVTEAQLTVIAILVTTSVFGNSFWDTHLARNISSEISNNICSVININNKIIQFASWELRHVVLAVSAILSAHQLFGYIKIIAGEGIGKNGSTVAGTSVISPLFPLLLVVLPFCIVYLQASSSVYDENITLFMLCFGAVSAKATNRLVIAHMSKSELRLWDWIYLGPFALVINQYYNSIFNELALLRLVTAYCYFSLLVYCTMVCRQFCELLNIKCFTITEKNVT